MSVLRDDLEVHCGIAAREIRAGRVVPFLGAGANLCGRPEELTWRPGQFDWLPDGKELAGYLAELFDYAERDRQDLVRVSQYVSLMVGAYPLYEELRHLFDGDYPPTRLHEFLAEIPAMLRGEQGRRDRASYQLIVTTNYDDLLERAFAKQGEPYDLVTYNAVGQHGGKFTHHPWGGEPKVILEPNTYSGVSTDRRTVILKIHGAIDRRDPAGDSYVITEDHYIDYLARTDVSKLVPVTLVDKLRRSHCLFLGYSLRDWHLRVILNRIWGDEHLRSKSWAIQRQPDPLEVRLWGTRDVEILRTALEDYIDKLRQALGNAVA